MNEYLIFIMKMLLISFAKYGPPLKNVQVYLYLHFILLLTTRIAARGVLPPGLIKTIVHFSDYTGLNLCISRPQKGIICVSTPVHKHNCESK